MTALLQLRAISKNYGRFTALRDVDLTVDEGSVTCVLGDNGAGKSTLIKIISGLHQQTSGELLIDGEPVTFTTPAQAQKRGIATVYQDLALAPLMSVWRNFFLGNELRSGPFLDISAMKRITDQALRTLGIEIADLDRAVGRLSGGQRQVIAIARAIHFGARVIILDEPTAALGVKQSAVVLRYIATLRERGIGVVFITHNPHHAHLVGDHFVVLKLGEVTLDARHDEVTVEQLTAEMAGGRELDDLAAELQRSSANGSADA